MAAGWDVPLRHSTPTPLFDNRPPPGPSGKGQPRWHVVSRCWKRRHSLDRPVEERLERRAQGIIFRYAGVIQCQGEARFRSVVHLLMFAVSGMQTNDKGLIGDGPGVVRRATKRLRPVRSQAFAVLPVKAMRKCVADYWIRHTPRMPCTGKRQKRRKAADGMVDGLYHAWSLFVTRGYVCNMNSPRCGSRPARGRSL